MGTEFELKYGITQKCQEEILSRYPDHVTIRMETTYFDTPHRALSQKRYTLRLRLENGCPVCTVKTPLPGFGRGEWEVSEPSIEAAIPRLCAAGAPAELLDDTKDGIVPICGAKFIRRAVLLKTPAFSAELALDRGTLHGGGKEAPLCEAELEYKSGDMDAFLAFSREFAEKYRLKPEPQSKFRRALNLYLGEK